MIERSGYDHSKSKISTTEKGNLTEVVLNIGAGVNCFMEKAQEANSKYEITKRLGISNNIENYICVGFLGVRLMRQYERRMRDLIRESDFFNTRIDKGIYDDAEGARLGALELSWTINQMSEKYKINPDRRNTMELAVNNLTSQCFLKDRFKNMIAEVKFNPDKSMLKKWEQRWKPELDRLQTAPAQS